MGIIKVLDKQVAELIAAGEVVERPASIVKELVENSIDAGASKINVEIRGGGIKYIKISDDGCGIIREDISNAFIRHATSKVSTQQDLESIVTFGFRGEALASIAAMCQVELITRTKDENIGTKFTIEGTEKSDILDIGCPVGTTIIVKNVFFNTPARLKFLKKDSYEGSNIVSVLEKLAVINSNISFKLIKDGEIALNTPGNGDLFSTIHSIMGSEFSKSLISVEYKDSIFEVNGFITSPTASKATRAMENFYINKRFVRSKTCIAALEEAYKGCVMIGKFPGCILNVKIPANTVDVNVHPAKTEVRFSEENMVYNAIFNSCKFALNKQMQELTIREDAPKKKNIINEFTLKNFDYTKKQDAFKKELYKNNAVNEVYKYAQIENNDRNKFHGNENHYNLEETSIDRMALEKGKSVTNNLLQKANNSNLNKNNIHLSEKLEEKLECNAQIISNSNESNFTVIGQAFSTYIIIEKNDTLILIDKHAAHERYIYNNLKNNQSLESQILLENLSFNVTLDEYITILDNKEKLKKLGFDVDSFGKYIIVLREIPAMLNTDNAKEALLEIIPKIETAIDLTPSAIDEAYHSIACRAAIKAGDFTGEKDMKFLAELISKNDDISYCPHGRPVMIEIKKTKLERMFGRIV